MCTLRLKLRYLLIIFQKRPFVRDSVLFTIEGSFASDFGWVFETLLQVLVIQMQEDIHPFLQSWEAGGEGPPNREQQLREQIDAC